MKSKGILQLSGEKLRCAAMPLGGIGTGSIAIGGDGLLKQWQITNTVRHRAFVPNSFFGVWTKKVGDTGTPSVCRALMCPKVHEFPNFVPAELVSDHKVEPGMKEMFKILPGVEDIRFIGEYPVAFLEFIDPSLPIDISLITFNPFVPLDPKNSGLPVIVFKFHIQNSSEAPCEVALVGNLLNFLGWDGIKGLKGDSSLLFAGNINYYKEIGDWHAIQMKSKTVLKSDRRFGEVTIAIDQPEAMVTTQWNDLENFWACFSDKGVLPDPISEEVSPIGESWVGSLGSRKTLNPGESVEIRFFLAWNFPNRVVDWIIDDTQIPDKNTEFWIGNRYSEWFKRNSIEVIKYVRDNWSNLSDKTEKFHEIFYSSALPPEVLTSISAPISTIRAPTCFWMRDGAFHGFEGCHGASTAVSSGGCCPLDCTHVWNYSFSLAHLYPSLERTMRETEFKMQHETGYLPHRSVVPMYLPQLLKGGSWDMIGPAIDGMLGTILKIYRDYLITGDLNFLKKSWPFIERLIDYIFKNCDNDLKGIMYLDQPNTYDCTIYGINTFIGSLYLVTLLALEEIVKRLELPDLPQKFRGIYNSGRQILDEECWNGEYYIQKYDEENIKQHQYGMGCFSDQLMGQWWAFHLGLGYILPSEHVDKAVESIFKYNFKESLENVEQTFRIFASKTDSGLMTCMWPHGGKPEEPTLYSDEVWTGIEYEVAALCIYTGKIPEALKILQAVRNRYDGSRRNPWNEVECGDHYVRAMSSWTLLHALTGVDYSVESKQFTLGPKINSDNFQTFFITATAWGQVKQQITGEKSSCSLSVSHGSLEVKSICLNAIGDFSPSKCSVAELTSEKGIESQINVDISIQNSSIKITFQEYIIIKENQQLLIELT